MNIGFALCGSFCTYSKVFPIMELLSRDYTVTPIFSQASCTTDSRFGTAREHIDLAREICGTEPLHTLPQTEPIGPKKLLDALVIAPCTGSTLAKLAHSIADGPVTMAAKSHLRNGRPVLIAVSTNDGLCGAAENIGRLLARKHYYFVPFGQDDPLGKPASLVADFAQLPQALEAALQGRQLQPLLVSSAPARKGAASPRLSTAAAHTPEADRSPEAEQFPETEQFPEAGRSLEPSHSQDAAPFPEPDLFPDSDLFTDSDLFPDSDPDGWQDVFCPWSPPPAW